MTDSELQELERMADERKVLFPERIKALVQEVAKGRSEGFGAVREL